MPSIKDITGLIVAGIIGFIIYKFAKGDWKIPSLSLGDLLPKPEPTVPQYLTETPLPTITQQATQLQYGGSRTVDEYLKTPVPSQYGMGLSTETILKAFPVESYEGAIEVRTYSRDPAFGSAGISTAAGSQYFKATGRVLPQ